MLDPFFAGFTGIASDPDTALHAMAPNGSRGLAGDAGLIGTAMAHRDGCLASIVGHPHWPAAVAGEASAAGNAEALLAMWARYGPDTPRHIGGAFALAIIDTEARQALLAIDRMGQYPLIYQPTGHGGLIFATNARLLQAHPDARGGLDPQAIHDYLYHHMIAAPRSIHAGCRRLRGAEYLLWRAGSGVQTATYWLPDFAGAGSSPPGGDELLATLGKAIPSGDDKQQGAFLSGGLDSSTIVGLMAQQQGDPVRAFCAGFDAPGYDELDYARATARHFGARAAECLITPADVAATLPEVATAWDEPFGNSSALPALHCARLAASQGITTLMAGDGGDELFAGNKRYLEQGVFERYRRLPAALRHRLLTPLLSRLPDTAGLLGKARRYVEQAETPLPDRLQRYNFLHRHDPAGIFDPELLAAVDSQAPLADLRERYAAPADADSIQRMLYMDWQVTLADNDLRKVRGMCQLAGVDVIFPFLDDEVVSLASRVPSQALLANGKLRHYYREAVRDFLPAATLNKSKHGFGLPFGVWLRDDPQLRELAGDALTSLAGRGLFRRDFLEQTRQRHDEVHAAYYGELIWLLTVLELWLQDYDARTP